MDDFDKELEELSDAVSKDEEMHAARRRFEQSALWDEHKRFHDENHTQARLVVWEETLPMPLEPQFQEDVAVPERKHIKVGGCECQPRLGLMQLDDAGALVAGIPPPVEEAKAYEASPPTYNASQGPLQTVYNGASGEQKELYR